MNTASGMGVISSLFWLVCPSFAAAQQQLLVQGNGKLAIVNPTGEIRWEMPWGPIHDLHVLPNGHFLLQRGAAQVAEIDPATKQVVWSYDSATANGNEGKKVEIHSFQPLADGHLMIAESGLARIIEINREGQLLRQIKLHVDHPHPHTDTRLVRKLPSGNYLVCHEGDGRVREYEGQTGKIVWDFAVPLFGQTPRGGHGPEAFGNKCFAALRLPNANTLMSTGNGHGILEVTPDQKMVRQIKQQDLPGITLAWVTTLEVLPNGHWLIGNCHAGPENPQVIEWDPAAEKVVWRFSQFDAFGNNVSNTLAMGLGGKGLR